ncbi:hypothetical protein [Cyanobacterium aponinum]|uniref:hypothetical protein n=1 Tax=Cyanobacterium aponinum TaxID=379064 RepID=UPI000C12DA95|nr:hypothetical protein [Cyanobacterium aponinum]PHV63205.1 hypothetical protein CSQ80_06630 [Cyanobacterium aponinum IPPAS B-1201]
MINYNPIVLNTIIIDAEQIVWIEIDTVNSILVYMKNNECIKLVGEDAGRLILTVKTISGINLSSQFASFLEYLPQSEQAEKDIDSVPY